MSYPRNAASPPHFLVGYVYQISDGAVQTSGVSARVKTGTGSWGAAAGTLDCDTTSGAWTYTPTQGETNAEAFSVSLYKASCSGVGMTVITSRSSTSGYAGLDWGQVIGASSTVGLSGTTIKAVTDAVTLPSSASINITGNITGNLSGSVGSVTGAVGSVTGNVGGSVASVTGAVGSVTGNVGGNVTGSVGSVVAGGITSSSFAAGAITAASIAASALNGKGDWQTVIWSSPTATVNLSGTTIKAVTDSVAATVADKTGYKLASDGLAAISAWTVAITGNLTGNVSGSVNSVATTVSANVVQWNSGSLPSFPSNFGALLINGSGHISRVVLVDTTTVNSDMRGTDGAALATHWTSTRAGYLDSVLVAANANQRTVQVTGSQHVAADVHELQPAVIESQHFGLGAVDANALAADASSEIATAVRAELATELARINVPIDSRLATIAYTAPPSATTIADTTLGRSVSNVEATASEHSICTLVLAALESSVIGATWTIKRTDGTTTHVTKTVTTDASAEPITGVT